MPVLEVKYKKIELLYIIVKQTVINGFMIIIKIGIVLIYCILFNISSSCKRNQLTYKVV